MLKLIATTIVIVLVSLSALAEAQAETTKKFKAAGPENCTCEIAGKSGLPGGGQVCVRCVMSNECAC